MAKCLLREIRTLHDGRYQSLRSSAPVPMWELLIGEPYAGKPPVRFGGRGGREVIPTPMSRFIITFLCRRYTAQEYVYALPRVDTRGYIPLPLRGLEGASFVQCNRAQWVQSAEF